VVEVAGLLHLLVRELQPLLDLAARLRRPFAKPALQLVEGRRSDEDRHGSGLRIPNRARPLRLQLEHTALPVCVNAPDLCAQRSVALPGDVDDVLEKLACFDAAQELAFVEEVVVAALGLPGTLRTRGRRDRDFEVVTPSDERPDESSLPSPRRTGDDEELQRRSRPTSSAR